VSDEGVKEPDVREVTILEDGSLVVEFNQDFGYPKVHRCLFTADVLYALSQEYADFPDEPPEEDDLKGVPMVDVEDVFPEETESGEGTSGDGFPDAKEEPDAS